MNARDALRELVLAYIPETAPTETKRTLAICIKQAIDEWIQTEMDREVAAAIRSNLQRAILQAIDGWSREHCAPQAIEAEPEPKPPTRRKKTQPAQEAAQ